MYFKGVNRGVSFTKAGTYVLGFVILLGLLAGSSGYNALFLTLAFGSGLLITSGLLSERSIRFFDAQLADDKQAEANAPFGITIRFRNENDELPVFGTEVVVTKTVPRFRTFNPTFQSVGAAHVLRLIPSEERLVSVPCKGLPRGIYRDLPLIIRTLFPFGLISKFKVGTSEKRLVIFPARDTSLFREIEQEMSQSRFVGEEPIEFHSHRLYTIGDPSRKVDWRKSAGKPSSQWQVKVYPKATDSRVIVIRPEWPSTLDEKFLSRVLSACEAIPQHFPEMYLELPNSKGYLSGRDAIRTFLAGYPEEPEGGRPLPNQSMITLRLGRHMHRWEESR